MLLSFLFHQKSISRPTECIPLLYNASNASNDELLYLAITIYSIFYPYCTQNTTSHQSLLLEATILSLSSSLRQFDVNFARLFIECILTPIDPIILFLFFINIYIPCIYPAYTNLFHAFKYSEYSNRTFLFMNLIFKQT